MMKHLFKGLWRVSVMVLIMGCNRDSPPPSPGAPSASAKLPDEIYLANAPAGAQNVRDAKAAGKNGDSVVLVGRIGGSKQAFVEGRAVFTLVDCRLKACGEGPTADSCETPWDYCCEPRDEITANTATIQIVGPDAKPLRVDLKSVKGFRPLATVTVQGTIVETTNGNLLIRASGIHLQS